MSGTTEKNSGGATATATTISDDAGGAATVAVVTGSTTAAAATMATPRAEGAVTTTAATAVTTTPNDLLPSSLFLRTMLVYAFPFAFTFSWFVYMVSTSSWGVYSSGWPMTLTAVLGSFVAGCSPLGGGAAAYPVLVLVIRIVSRDARVFAMMMQSIGMTSASWRIALTAQHRIDYGIVSAMVLIGVLGFNVGYFLLEIPGLYVQSIYFTSTFVMGVLAQVFVNRLYFGEVRTREVVINRADVPAFVAVMFVGGILHSYVGTGADVLMYIYFRFAKNVDEVVATNYSVLLSTALSLYGFFNEPFVARAVISRRIWDFWLCVIPVVSLFAPLGSYLTNRVFSRRFLNAVIYALEISQYVAGFVIAIHKDPVALAISLAMVGVSLAFMAVTYVLHARKKDWALERVGGGVLVLSQAGKVGGEGGGEGVGGTGGDRLIEGGGGV
jgi:uncharacterized protein